MSWDALITGAVGVAGIGGTVLAARMTNKSQTANLVLSIDAENERARIADKRRIYATCLATLENVLPTIVTLRMLVADEQSDYETFKAAVAEMKAADTAMSVAVSELRLISPAKVSSLAEELSQHLREFLIDAKDGVNEGVSESKLTEAWTRLERQLYDAMRADLGETSLEDH